VPDAGGGARSGNADLEQAVAIAELRAEVAALRAAVAEISAPQGGLQHRLLTALAERFAALSEIQRELIEAELDAFRALALAPDRVAPDRPARAVDAAPARRTKGS